MSVLDLPALVRARLAADDAARGHFRQIGGAAELSAAQRTLKSIPAVFVLPLAETNGLPLWAGQFRQKKELRVAVLVAAMDAGDAAAGRAALRGLAKSRARVEDALIPPDAGWMPEGCSDVMAWAGGKLARLDENGCIWWQDEYAASQWVKTPY